MITEPNMDNYQLAEANLTEADTRAGGEDVITDSYRSATVSALLALVDATRVQTDAIRELTKAVKDGSTKAVRVETGPILR